MTNKENQPINLEDFKQVIRLFGEDHVRGRIQRWQRLGPDIAEIFLNLIYKGLYARKVLDPKVRQLCAISALTVLNALPQLRTHIVAAFRVGATEAEVKEAIIQMAAYGGMPHMVQAITLFLEIIEELKEKDMGK